MKRYFIGIDPGLKGGIGVVDENAQIVLAVPMPLKNNEIDSRMLAAYLKKTKDKGQVICHVEKVGAMPGQGVCAMFTFGKGVGAILSSLQILKMPYIEVRPQKWKSVVLAGLKWKAQTPRFKNDKSLSEEENKKLKKIHNSKKNKAKKEAKLVACQYIQKRFPDFDLNFGKKTPHDGVGDALCLALYGKMTD